MKHFLKNQWVTDNRAKISVFDLAVLRGFGVFDFLRTYNRKPFLLDEHINRFFNSLKVLKLKPVYTKEKIKELVKEGIKKNREGELNIRIIQTGGVSDDGLTPKKPELMILFTKATNYPTEYYTKGIKLITTPFSRVYPEAKTLNYIGGILALQEAKKKKAIEALYTDDKYLYECVTSNFFAVIKNTLITPKDKVLIGTVRNLVLSFAKNLGIKYKEAPIKVSDIPRFQEAFITASNKEIMPVIQIDNQKIGEGKPGKITIKLLEAYRKLTKFYTKKKLSTLKL